MQRPDHLPVYVPIAMRVLAAGISALALGPLTAIPLPAAPRPAASANDPWLPLSDHQ